MRRTYSILHLAVFFLFLHFILIEPPAVHARDIRVAEDCSLHDAIITFNTETSTGGCRMPTWGHTTIYLTKDITLTEPLPEIWADLTIDGRGHQISGDKLHQVFVVHNHELSISNLHIVDGFSAEHGGAIHVHFGELNLSNSSISNSTAVEDGGAIYARGSTVSIRASVISGSVAVSGSAIFLDEGSLHVSEITVSDNFASYSGAIYIRRVFATIVDSQVVRNFARGDAGSISAADSGINIKHSSIHANRTLGRGGGLSFNRANVAIHDVTISDNLAGMDGGGIYWTKTFSDTGSMGGLLKITQSALTGNRAVERGGAIFAIARDIQVSNSTFYDNKASGNGGALYAETTDVELTHVTLFRNEALNGGGVYMRTPDVLTLRNSIIAGSKGGDCVGGLAAKSGNWIEDGSCRARYMGNPQLNRFAGIPAYFPLRRESPAINRADPEYCLERDQNGTPRPQGEACDIGAYEAVDWLEATSARRISVPTKSPEIIVDEHCSLADAIVSANTDKAMGGCIAGDDADIIRLTADITLDDPMPDVTSEIVIEGEMQQESDVLNRIFAFIELRLSD